ncbi:hypothetical protein BsWGS_17441 [Bradybaena similaris]
MRRLNAVVTLVSVLVAVTVADITTTFVSPGDCVCSTANVNGRSRAGTSGSVVLTIPSGRCATIFGSVSPTVNGYKWFQLSYSGQILWAAGRYLSLAPSSTCSAPSVSGQCSSVQQQLACDILNNYRTNLTLATVHPSGRTDNAFASLNMRDMCDGRRAARSSYSCSECRSSPAPGGSVCIAESVLRYLRTLLSRGRVKVNEIAGACHSCTSKHYQGLAIDLDDGPRDREFINTCNSMGGLGIDERSHIHCQFSR